MVPLSLSLSPGTPFLSKPYASGVRRCSTSRSPPPPHLPCLPLLRISSCRFAHLQQPAGSAGFGRDGLWMKNGHHDRDIQITGASTSGISPSNADDVNELLGSGKVAVNSKGISILVKLAIALGIAATITVSSYLIKSPTPGTSFSFPVVVDSLSHSAPSSSSVGFTFSLSGYRVFLPEYTPGWVYFWLLMAAGCGLFISEEALNVWVGISLARKLSLDGTWSSFAQSFSNNAPYIISTVLWVYWGVCISDMIPFYFGKLFRQTKASEDICSKLGIGKTKAVSITRAVQKYGNLIGFVERFSIGMRNPTSFLAGAWGISADCFFAGVCFGGFFTLLIQLGIGFLLREHPLMALAGVATVVGIWSIFPYLLAALTALFLYFRRRSVN